MVNFFLTALTINLKQIMMAYNLLTSNITLFSSSHSHIDVLPVRNSISKVEKGEGHKTFRYKKKVQKRNEYPNRKEIILCR